MRLLRLRRRADWVLAVVDLGLAVLACWLAYAVRFQGNPALPASFHHRYVAASIGVGVAQVVIGRSAGLYRRSVLRLGARTVEPAFDTGVVVGVLLLVADPVVLSGDISRAWIGLVTLLLIVFAIAGRSVLAHSRRALVPLGVGLERYIVVGDDASGRRLLRDLTRAPGTPYQIVEVLPRTASTDELATRARTLHVDGLVLPADIDARDAGRLGSALSGAGIDVLIAPRLGALDLRVASVTMLHGVPLLRTAGLSPRRPAVRSQLRPRHRHGVAILGTRGIPANYGGFETFAERLACHLVEHGVPVTVYCRRHHATAGDRWQGIRLVTLPTIRSKYLDTVVHSVLSAVHLLFRSRARSVVLCNAANAPVLPLLRAGGARVVMNVDGLEWRRGKWGVLGRSWYRMGEWLAVRASAVLVTDAEEVRTYYRVRHDTDSVMIPYGADLLPRSTGVVPAEVAADLPDAGFALYVSRWEPENNPLLVARAHAAAGVTLGLVMLGRATYDDRLEREVRAAAGAGAVLPGPVFGDGYRALQTRARGYIHATEVGGTHPALIEAMGASNHCLVLDTPENREVAGPHAWYFADEPELADLLRRLDRLSEPELRSLQQQSRDRAAATFSWDAVGAAYRELLTGSR